MYMHMNQAGVNLRVTGLQKVVRHLVSAILNVVMQWHVVGRQTGIIPIAVGRHHMVGHLAIAIPKVQ